MSTNSDCCSAATGGHVTLGHGFLRLKQILGDKKSGVPPIIPVGRSTWWEGVKSGRYPQPLKLSPRVTVWRTEDIQKLIQRA